MAQEHKADYPSDGYPFAAKGSAVREDVDNDKYMRKASAKLLDRDSENMRKQAKKVSSDQSKVSGKKADSKKTTKKVVTTKR